MGIIFLAIAAAPVPLEHLPVEIAWVDRAGNGESHLIKPPQAWLLRFREQKWQNAPGYPAASLQQLQDEGEDLDRVAARARIILLTPDSQNYAEGETAKRLGSLLGQARHAWMIPIQGIEKAYADACLPLMPRVSSRNKPGLAAMVADYQRNAHTVVDRCRSVEPACPSGDRSALADAKRLWRTWRAISEEVKRGASPKKAVPRPKT